MPNVIAQNGPIRYLSDGSVEIDEETYQALVEAGFIPATLQGSDDDDDADISGEDADDLVENLSVLGDLFGAKKKEKKKQNALMSLLSRLGKKPAKTTASVKKVTLDPKQVAANMIQSMQPGFLDGTETSNSAGDVTVFIRPQHDFHAEDVTFNGSTNGARVKSIWFGEKNIFNSNAGIDTSVFAANNTMRGLLKGAFVKAGLDIRVTFTLPGAGTASVTFVGKKPPMSC